MIGLIVPINVMYVFAKCRDEIIGRATARKKKEIYETYTVIDN